MKVVFMGTPDFARVSLEKLLSSSHHVLAVVTQPDRPKGRGMKIQPSPVKTLAERRHLPIFSPSRLPDYSLMDFLKEYQPEAIVVVAYGLKIPPELLYFAPFGCLNLHASLLPKYRGANPIQWAIIDGEKTTGITTMKMDEGWDTGAILLAKEVEIKEDDNFETLHDKLAEEGADLLVQTLTLLEKKLLTPTPQNNSEATYARKLSEKDVEINWENPTTDLINLIRALNPWPGAKANHSGRFLKIWSVRPTCSWHNLEDSAPGTVGEYSREDGGLPVRTGDGVLLITELQAPGRKKLTAQQFLTGNTLPEGAVLT